MRTASGLALQGEVPNRFDFVIEHRLGEARIGAEEQRCGHDIVGTLEISDDAERFGAIFLQLHEGGLTDEVSAEEHAVADLLFIEVAGQLCVIEWGVAFDAQEEAKPGAGGAAAAGVPGK